MKLPGQAELEQAVELFATEWHKRHPATPVPSILTASTPEQEADSLWQEARELFRDCQVNALTPVAAQPPEAVWTVLAGGSLMCPNNHVVKLDWNNCAICGLAVPANALWDARAQRAVLDARAELLWLRMQAGTHTV